MSDPFKIPVPEGATEIDLRPLLEPLIRFVMRAKLDPTFYPVEAVDSFTAELVADSAQGRLIETIKWEWIRDYMLAEGWRRSGGLTGGKAQYYPPKTKYDYGPRGICVMMKEEFLGPSHNEVNQNRWAIHKITMWRIQRTKVSRHQETATAHLIIASRSAIEQLGAVADEVSADL